tara:strand:- start:141 stop:1037 length:897 start_codon:yes stop_codon:yes gene_type:complete
MNNESASQSLPPLTWLRAFEAAGRVGSFKAAAEQLHVSPSTISHQIRDLEKYLGYPLFARQSGGIVLTEEGGSYFRPLSAAFDLLRSAGKDTARPGNVLRVGAFPFLANEILTPRISELKSVLGLSINLHTRTDVDLLSHVGAQDRLDVLIRYGRPGGFPGYLSTPLFDVEMVPIVGAKAAAIASPEKLLDQELIRVIGPFDGWQRWLDVYAPNRDIEFEIQTDSFHSAMLAVSRGEGVSLGITPFIDPWIEAGRIQALSQFSIDIDVSAYLVYGHHNHDNLAIKRLGEWLVNLLQPG